MTHLFADTEKRSGAKYIRDARDYVAEHGRPPRLSSSLVGTAEYKLRTNVQNQVKKGRFSEEEKSELEQLLVISRKNVGGLRSPPPPPSSTPKEAEKGGVGRHSRGESLYREVWAAAVVGWPFVRRNGRNSRIQVARED